MIWKEAKMHENIQNVENKAPVVTFTRFHFFNRVENETKDPLCLIYLYDIHCLTFYRKQTLIISVRVLYLTAHPADSKRSRLRPSVVRNFEIVRNYSKRIYRLLSRRFVYKKKKKKNNQTVRNVAANNQSNRLHSLKIFQNRLILESLLANAIGQKKKKMHRCANGLLEIHK